MNLDWYLLFLRRKHQVHQPLTLEPVIGVNDVICRARWQISNVDGCSISESPAKTKQRLVASVCIYSNHNFKKELRIDRNQGDESIGKSQ